MIYALFFPLAYVYYMLHINEIMIVLIKYRQEALGTTTTPLNMKFFFLFIFHISFHIFKREKYETYARKNGNKIQNLIIFRSVTVSFQRLFITLILLCTNTIRIIIMMMIKKKKHEKLLLFLFIFLTRNKIQFLSVCLLHTLTHTHFPFKFVRLLNNNILRRISEKQE